MAQPPVIQSVSEESYYIKSKLYNYYDCHTTPTATFAMTNGKAVCAGGATACHLDWSVAEWRDLQTNSAQW